MSLSISIFGKEVYDLDISDIIRFFSIEQEENSILEFKSGDVTLEQIHKEISAFLNTEGGILIIGAPQEQKSGINKVCKGDLKPNTKILSQDTLLRSIASNIAPSPINIKARSFQYEGGMVFVLEIAQSNTPPHQVSSEGKYYIRLERDAKAAPHGIVEALFNRRQRPQLTGDIKFIESQRVDEVLISFSISNESIITAERIGVMINVIGVRQIINSDMGEYAIRLADGRLYFQETLENNLLVKGLSIQFSTLVRMENNFGSVTFSFYCKDGILVNKQKLFTVRPFSIFRRYDSTLDTESDGKDIALEFKEFENNRIREILSLNIMKPEPIEERYNRISELVKFHGTELPESYIAFLEVSDGFKGIVNGRKLILYSIEELKNEEIWNRDEKLSILSIGTLEEYPILIKFSKDEGKSTTIFVWDQLERGRLNMNLEANSFYGFLNRVSS